MANQFLPKNLKKNNEGLYEIYDRFSFDNLFRFLLNNGFEHQEVLDFILCNCSLNALVFQERIHNNYYLNLSTEDTTSTDLVVLRNQYLFKFLYQIYINEVK